MSLSAPHIDKSRIVVTLDPRVDFEQDGVYAISTGGERIAHRVLQTQNFSDSSLSFTTKNPLNMAIASKMFIRAKFRVTISGTPPIGSYLVQIGSNDAARFMPLTSITSNISLDLNSQTFTQPINDYYDALMRYNESADYMGFDLSTCPSFQDTYQNYNDYLKYGSALNPLGNYGENSIHEPLRGGFKYSFYDLNGAPLAEPPIGDGSSKSVIVEFETREPILVSPLTWGHHNTKALIGISQITVLYNIDSYNTRIWCHNPDNGVVGFAVTAVNIRSAALEYIQITPKLSLPVAPTQRYPYSNIQRFPKSVGTVAPGEITSVTSDTISLIGVPKRIYFYLREANTARNYNSPDTFASLEKLSIYFNGAEGIFSQASKQQLYEVCRENGYRRSYQGFNDFEGGVMCIDCGKDIPLYSTEGVGSNENINFSFTAEFKNISDRIINYTLFTCIVYEGLVTIENGVVIPELCIVAPRDLVDSKVLQLLPHEREIDYLAIGGSFGSDSRRMMKKIKQGSKKVIDVGRKAYATIPDNVKKDIGKAALGTISAISPRIGNLIETYGPPAKQLYDTLHGNGWSEDKIYNQFIGAGYLPVKNSMQKGGKKLTQKELAKLLA